MRRPACPVSARSDASENTCTNDRRSDPSPGIQRVWLSPHSVTRARLSASHWTPTMGPALDSPAARLGERDDVASEHDPHGEVVTGARRPDRFNVWATLRDVVWPELASGEERPGPPALAIVDALLPVAVPDLLCDEPRENAGDESCTVSLRGETMRSRSDLRAIRSGRRAGVSAAQSAGR